MLVGFSNDMFRLLSQRNMSLAVRSIVNPNVVAVQSPCRNAISCPLENASISDFIDDASSRLHKSEDDATILFQFRHVVDQVHCLGSSTCLYITCSRQNYTVNNISNLSQRWDRASYDDECNIENVGT